MKKIKLGQIGITDNHAESKMLAARNLSELYEIVGYAEENDEAVCKQCNLPAYKGLPRMSLDEIIERCDALIICANAYDLLKIGKKCVDSGKHIHTSIPESGKLKEWKALLDSARAQKLIIQPGYIYRYVPSVIKALAQIKNGELGRIYSVNAEINVSNSALHNEARANFCEGAMYTLGINFVDLITFFLGEPEKIYSYFCSTALGDMKSQKKELAVLEYDTAFARILISTFEKRGREQKKITVCGSDGQLDIRLPNNKSSSETQGQLNKVFKGMLQSFYEYIMGSRENIFSLKHEYTVQQITSDIMGGIIFDS